MAPRWARLANDLTRPLGQLARFARPPAAAETGPLLDEELLRGLERVALATRNQWARRVGGARRSNRRTPASEFAEYRAYSPGDDLRRIDWHVYARHKQLVTRLGELQAGATVHLIVDRSRSMDWGTPNKFFRARQIAAAIGYVALCQLEQLRLETVDAPRPIVSRTPAPVAGRRDAPVDPAAALPLSAGPALDPGATAYHGKANAYRLLLALSSLTPLPPGEATDTDVIERRLANRVQTYRPGDLAVIVSDLLTPTAYRGVVDGLVARGVEARVIHVLAPQELRAAELGACEFIDAETGDRRGLTLEGATVAAYQTRLAEWLAGIETYCAERGVVYARIDTAAEIQEVVLGDLLRRGVLA